MATSRCRGAHAGDRFALALISLALDENDATDLLFGPDRSWVRQCHRGESGTRRRRMPIDLHTRLVANGIVSVEPTALMNAIARGPGLTR